ncbi:MAG: hypothetical protein ACPK85_02470 [Methanosarcina sp.]
MSGEKAKENINSVRRKHVQGRWMAPGIGIGATLGILFGNFVLSPLIGSYTTGFMLGMSMGAAIGLVLGLSVNK